MCFVCVCASVLGIGIFLVVSVLVFLLDGCVCLYVSCDCSRFLYFYVVSITIGGFD